MTSEKNAIINKQTSDLIIFQDQIQKIKRSSMSEIDESLPKKIKLEKTFTDPLVEECMIDESSTSDIKRYIREQVKISERKILLKMDRIERKLNQLLALNGSNVDSDSDEKPDISGDIIEEYVNYELEENDELEQGHGQIDEFSSLIFPIADEGTFDWFMLKLKDEEYRSILVNKRWTLTRNVGTRSFNVSVKDFLRMHFDLSVCIKYSVSGFGSRGSKKKKVDSKTLTFYVYECFNKSQPNIYTMDDVTKAITQFWGRSQDTYTKMHDRALKRELINN
ncbi:unnamed protein product [Chironomus riparius]|uniref:DUF4806 domain-containing protein n=1 Tax=Chironomus riparius TaxID=315576 RepID=A0A9N9RPG5_9DIPT|nr:unnamed protein product [Chironomus riparius]